MSDWEIKVSRWILKKDKETEGIVERLGHSSGVKKGKIAKLYSVGLK